MKKDIGEHIISKLDLPDIVKILSDELSGSELNTILLEVFNRRIQQETPSSLLNKYEGNKLVKPANIDVLRYKEQELTCYKVLASRGFEPIEHSPAAQLGTSSVVATVDQKKVLTALRNTEMQADPTNATALHYASLKKKGGLDSRTYNYSNISRIIRTQVFDNPNFTPHFSVICLISCGKDTGSFNFEKEDLQRNEAFSTMVRKAVEMAKKYYSEGITLEETASRLYVSEEYLSTQFKKETQSSFTETVRKFRIEKIKDLLLNSKLKLNQIAELTGYSDPKYMSRVFKEEVGMLPTEFRKKMQ